MTWLYDYTSYKQYSSEYDAYEKRDKRFNRGQVIRVLKDIIKIKKNENKLEYIIKKELG